MPADRLVAVGRNAAVGGAAVVEIFVAEVDPRVVPADDRRGRIDAVAIEVDMVAEAVRRPRYIALTRTPAVALSGWSKSPVRRTPPHCPPSGQRAVGVRRRPLQHPVDDPAAAAAPEDHRVGAFQHLDPVDIVEIAEILDVVANAIDEEVGGAAVAAKHDLVAIALAAAIGGAGHEIEQIGDRA